MRTIKENYFGWDWVEKYRVLGICRLDLKIELASKLKQMGKELIAFRSIDQDGDIWCETAFIFKSEEDVNKGLVKDSPMLINAFCDIDDPDDKTLQDFEVQVIGEIINSVSFYTEYAHEVRLVRMNKGYVYNLA